MTSPPACRALEPADHRVRGNDLSDQAAPLYVVIVPYRLLPFAGRASGPHQKGPASGETRQRLDHPKPLARLGARPLVRYATGAREA